MTPDRPNSLNAAIAPNIFDAFLDTKLLLPLVLGHLLSPRLWDFSKRVQKRFATTEQMRSVDSAPNSDALFMVKAIQLELNRHFKHLHQNEYAEIYGELNLADEAHRLGKSRMDFAVEKLLASYRKLLDSGTISAETFQRMTTGLEQGRFPAFYYANFDVIRANRLLGSGKASAPLGLTSCLDEVSIFAALAMTLPAGNIENVISLSSVTHYTAFGWSQSGEIWWFYGKNKLLTATDWKQLVAQDFNGDAQAAFNRYLQDFDRITSVAGTFDMTTGHTAIPLDHIEEIVQKLDQFFDCRLQQLAAGLAQPKTILPETEIASILRGLLGTQSIEQARARLLDSDDHACQQVLYSYRSLKVNDLQPYLTVARHHPHARRIGAGLQSLQEAFDLVQNIPGKASIFDDRDRIAMPDETLRLQTGSDIDKALLLHVLIEHYQTTIHYQTTTAAESLISTLVTSDDSYVCGPHTCFSLNTMTMTSHPQHGVRMTFADPIEL